MLLNVLFTDNEESTLKNNHLRLDIFIIDRRTDKKVECYYCHHGAGKNIVILTYDSSSVSSSTCAKAYSTHWINILVGDV